MHQHPLRANGLRPGADTCQRRLPDMPPFPTGYKVFIMTRRTMNTAEKHLRDVDSVLGAIMDSVESEGSRPAWWPDSRRPADPNMPTDSYGVPVRAVVSLQRIGEPWRPHRSLACPCVWENAHATPQV